MPAAPENELLVLKNQADMMRREIADVERRIHELEKKD
jgi:hypothetical protein